MLGIRPRSAPWLPLLMASAFAVALVAARFAATGKVTFVFLSWNLLLAWTPVALGYAFARSTGTLARAALFLCWLAFLPNAPYLVTDLIHLKARTGVPLWFDLALLAAFAALGLALWVTALRPVHRQFTAHFGERWAPAFVVVVSLASGHALYLGRFLRLNSWDPLLAPGYSFTLWLETLSTPAPATGAWGVTVLYGAFLAVAYWVAEASAGPAESPLPVAR